MDSSVKRTVIVCVTVVLCVVILSGSIKSLGKSIERASGSIGNGLMNSRARVTIPSNFDVRLHNGGNGDLKVRLEND